MLITLLLGLTTAGMAAGLWYRRRAKIKQITSLVWPPNLRKDQIANYCWVYFKKSGWSFSQTSEENFRFRIISNNLSIVIMTTDYEMRSSLTEVEYIRALGRRMRYYTSKLRMRVACIVNFDVSCFGYEAALDEDYVIIHYKDLHKINRMLDISAVCLSEVDAQMEYFLGGNRVVCRKFARQLLAADDIQGAIRWMDYTIRSTFQSAEDYRFLSRLHLRVNNVTQAFRFARIAMSLEPGNKQFYDDVTKIEEMLRKLPPLSK